VGNGEKLPFWLIEKYLGDGPCLLTLVLISCDEENKPFEFFRTDICGSKNWRGLDADILDVGLAEQF